MTTSKGDFREQAARSIIIFVTGYREYMAKAFDVQAFHYLLKPIDKEKFAQVLEKACREAAHIQKQKKEYILLKVNDGRDSSWERRKVWLADVLYCQRAEKKGISFAASFHYPAEAPFDI
ncbi:putative response regulator receiver protein [Selenomonas ruminantium subsp. lactilytica TAM6421]|uniref:Putative response regulator receiver protein n=1 Tax=Selenomonas ruminantium subsp. lactilytica (strain NBRC 103574 / TAM6421) TaxID=927704 RepID=I0GSB9_SELRL|nr:response regulator [Selenomonas ruminantium]BAL83656.1 putative response regulator receiver protein [Selenomonas ruminantium subsp. lactilytica TAM6421]